jgi:hypothetical protein
MVNTTIRQLRPRKDAADAVIPVTVETRLHSVNYTPQPMAKDLFEEPLRRMARVTARRATRLPLWARRVAVGVITR